MNYFKGMQKPHTNDQLQGNLSSLVLLEILKIPNKVKQISSLYQFCHNIDMVLGLHCLLELKQ